MYHGWDKPGTTPAQKGSLHPAAIAATGRSASPEYRPPPSEARTPTKKRLGLTQSRTPRSVLYRLWGGGGGPQRAVRAPLHRPPGDEQAPGGASPGVSLRMKRVRGNERRSARYAAAQRKALCPPAADVSAAPHQRKSTSAAICVPVFVGGWLPRGAPAVREVAACAPRGAAPPPAARTPDARTPGETGRLLSRASPSLTSASQDPHVRLRGPIACAGAQEAPQRGGVGTQQKAPRCFFNGRARGAEAKARRELRAFVWWVRFVFDGRGAVRVGRRGA